MNILVIGAGYVGLTTACCLASCGHRVVAVDSDEKKIDKLNAGQMPFFEPELAPLLQIGLQTSRLLFINQAEDFINQAEVICICVGTPALGNGQADLSEIYRVAKTIGKNLKSWTIVAIKSTVPIGTTKKVGKIISQHGQTDCAVAMVPEFLREGSAVKDFLHPDRIVIGVEDDKAKERLLRLYDNIAAHKLITNWATAEMIKYASNAFLATKISFINEIANICEEVKANVDQVALGMGLDKRIGEHFLNAGVGYGGSCFPKDVRALNYLAGQNGYPFQLLKAVIEVNNQQRWLFYRKIVNALVNVENKIIAVWGVAFKPNTDDIRESIAVDIIRKLIDDGARVRVYDPASLNNAQLLFGNAIEYCTSAESSIEGAEAVVIMTAWDEFRTINLEALRTKMRRPLIIDGRNLFLPPLLKDAQIEYISIGRN